MDDAAHESADDTPRAADWLRRGCFGLGVLALAASVALGFVESARLFGMPPIDGGATLLGDHYFDRGDFARGLEEYRLAALIDPANYSASPDIGYSVTPPPDAAARIARARRIVARQPGSARAHFLLGKALLTAGQGREALDEIDRARELDPDLPGAPSALAHALLLLDDPASAVPLFEQALARTPRDAELRDAYALALYRSGQRAAAAREFARAQEAREAGSTP